MLTLPKITMRVINMINLALFVAFLVTLFITYKQSQFKDTKTIATKFVAVGIVFAVIGIVVALFFKALWLFIAGFIAYLVYSFYKTKK
jgi:uncharacterized protein YacL